MVRSLITGIKIMKNKSNLFIVGDAKVRFVSIYHYFSKTILEKTHTGADSISYIDSKVSVEEICDVNLYTRILRN